MRALGGTGWWLSVVVGLVGAFVIAPRCEAECPGDLSNLDGVSGFVINGIESNDESGLSVSIAGDVNGDGYDDVMIGARLADPNGALEAGQTYVVFGRPRPFGSSLDASALDGANGFTVNGVAGDSSGRSVSGAGDVNGDGYDDLIIGAPVADVGGRIAAGRAYVVFGHAGPYAAVLESSTLDGANGFALNGVSDGDGAGVVSGAGDVNRDGFDDVIVGAALAAANGNAASGQSYVFFGGPGPFPPAVELSSLDGTNGFVLNGVAAYDQAGGGVATAGDVNGDGFGDLAIAATAASPNGTNTAGEVYVVFGHAGPFGASLDLATLNGTNGFRLEGTAEFDQLGTSLSRCDANGDGFDDVIASASNAEVNGLSGAGKTFVLLGHAGAFAASTAVSTLDGSDGFVLDGIDAYDFSGRGAAGAGDVNGDGFEDVLIGAMWADPNGKSAAGESYLVFGHAGPFPAALDLATIDGVTGVVLNGVDALDASGIGVAGGGDVDGDGLDDIVIGAYAADQGPALNAGESYVVFGTTGFLPAAGVVVGEGYGPANPNRVRGFDASGVATAVDFLAYGAGGRGANVAVGNLDGGECSEIVTGPGPGPSYGPQVRAFDVAGSAINKVNYFAYGTLRFGVNVGTVDVDGDGFSEIVSGAGPGQVFGPHVRGWDFGGGRITPLNINFFSYMTLKWGVNVGGGDVEDDAFAEMLTGPGPGAAFAPTVRGWDFDAASVGPIVGIRFNPYASRYGAQIAGGDADADGFDEIATAPGAGPSNAQLYRGFDYDGAAVAPAPGFMVTPTGFMFGGHLGLGDLNADARAELITANGPDAAASSRVEAYIYDGASVTVGIGFVPFTSNFGAQVAVGGLGY